jgi:hypothetical protein
VPDASPMRSGGGAPRVAIQALIQCQVRKKVASERASSPRQRGAICSAGRSFWIEKRIVSAQAIAVSV